MVLLDTNALTLPVQFGVDPFGELGRLLGTYEPVVLEETLEELRKLGRRGGRDGAAARVGLALAGRCRVVKGGADPGTVDEKIVRFAEKNHALVVTNDRALKQELRERGIRVISLRQQKRLEIGE